MCTCVRGEGLGQIALCDFSRILEDGRPCSSLCGRPRRESQEASCNFDKASKKDVTLRRRGDDENGNASNLTKIMLEAGVCLHTPASSMIFVGLLSLPFSSSPLRRNVTFFCLPCQSCNSLLDFLCEVVCINCYKAGHLKF